MNNFDAKPGIIKSTHTPWVLPYLSIAAAALIVIVLGIMGISAAASTLVQALSEAWS